MQALPGRSHPKVDCPFNPLAGVLVAGHGVKITVTEQNSGGTMHIAVVNPE